MDKQTNLELSEETHKISQTVRELAAELLEYSDRVYKLVKFYARHRQAINQIQRSVDSIEKLISDGENVETNQIRLNCLQSILALFKEVEDETIKE